MKGPRENPGFAGRVLKVTNMEIPGYILLLLGSVRATGWESMLIFLWQRHSSHFKWSRPIVIILVIHSWFLENKSLPSVVKYAWCKSSSLWSWKSLGKLAFIYSFTVPDHTHYHALPAWSNRRQTTKLCWAVILVVVHLSTQGGSKIFHKRLAVCDDAIHSPPPHSHTFNRVCKHMSFDELQESMW